MKKYFAIMGICLIVIAGVVAGYAMGSASNDMSCDNVREAYVESYLVNRFGAADYTVEISAIEDNEIKFYWASDDGHEGYSRVLDITQIDNHWNS